MNHTFSSEEVLSLRRAIQLAGRIDEFRLVDGWQRSPVDPMRLVEACPELSLAEGYVLRGYIFSSGSDGNGIVWALPIDAPFPAPEECKTLEDRFLSPPKPADALEDFRTVLWGTGSPYSYLCASLLVRELVEFGARWHGSDWSDHKILFANPFDEPGSNPLWPTDESEWTWDDGVPDAWAPNVDLTTDRAEVRFLTFTALGSRRIWHHQDSYQRGSYVAAVETTPLGEGGPGYVH